MKFLRNRDKPDPQGYELADVTIYRGQRLHELELYLPATPATKTLIKDLKFRAIDAQTRQEDNAQETAEFPAVAPAVKRATPSNAKENDSSTDRDDMFAQAQEDEIGLIQTHRKLYEWDAPLALIQDQRSADTDLHTRDQDIFLKLKKLGHMRRIAQPECELVFDALAQLRQRQPHFSAVVDLVRQHLRLVLAQGKPLHLPPILLLGEPGVGKTHFIEQLAAALQLLLRRHGFDSATTGSTLTGSEKHWGNTSYGLMFEILCLNDIINPVVLLEELDKTHRNSAAPLHTLLEPVSAKQVTDLSVGITFDASSVSWIATANDASRIPASLRSRFIEFFILPPLGQQALEVAGHIAESVFLELNLPDIDRVPASITKLLAHLTAREQMQILKRAFASAFDDDRMCIEIRDIPSSALSDDNDDNLNQNEEKPRSIH